MTFCPTPSVPYPFPELFVHHTVSAGDVRLHVAGAPGSGPDAGRIFFVPGYTDHLGRYGELFTHLLRRGFSVWGMDLRGHGLSGGPRGFIRHFSDYLDDLERAFRHAREQSDAPPDARWILFGHSTGGLVAISALLRRPVPLLDAGVCGVAVSSPLLGLRLSAPMWRRVLGAVASRLLPRFSLEAGVAEYPSTHDGEMERKKHDDPLVFTSVNARWYTEVAAEMAWVRARAGECPVPLYAVQGEADPVVDPAATAAFVKGCPDGELSLLPDLYHEILMETCRTEIWDAAADWMETRGAGRSDGIRRPSG
ncbi:MAG: alpha/beta hydrolase [Leptospirillia bacterium]